MIASKQNKNVSASELVTNLSNHLPIELLGYKKKTNYWQTLQFRYHRQLSKSKQTTPKLSDRWGTCEKLIEGR